MKRMLEMGGTAWSLLRAGWGVWRAWGAVRSEGVKVEDARTLKQAQTLASALPPLLSALGLVVAPNWLTAMVTAMLAIYGAWNGGATLASTTQIGAGTLFQSAPSTAPAAPVVTAEHQAPKDAIGARDREDSPWQTELDEEGL